MLQKREEEIIKSATEVLRKMLQPSRIIHFGSRAKGDHGDHADFDFAVEAQKPDISKQREVSEEFDKISGLYLPAIESVLLKLGSM